MYQGICKNAAPLQSATASKNTFEWMTSIEHTFAELKKRLCRPPVPVYTTIAETFPVVMDASKYSVGDFLS